MGHRNVDLQLPICKTSSCHYYLYLRIVSPLTLLEVEDEKKKIERENYTQTGIHLNPENTYFVDIISNFLRHSWFYFSSFNDFSPFCVCAFVCVWMWSVYYFNTSCLSYYRNKKRFMQKKIKNKKRKKRIQQEENMKKE